MEALSTNADCLEAMGASDRPENMGTLTNHQIFKTNDIIWGLSLIHI